MWRLERSEKEEDGILLALLKKEVWSFVTTWMNLEDMATEAMHREESGMISFLCRNSKCQTHRIREQKILLHGG